VSDRRTGRLPLTIAMGTHGHTEAIKNRQVQPAGIALEFVNVEPLIAAYRRMIRNLEFDLCELAPTTYLAAREAGVPIVALPIFLTRAFHHSEFVCRTGSGIRFPKDLEGRNAGVRAYSVSTGVWARAVLQHEFEVDLNRVNWIVDDEEHVTSLVLPPNVAHVAAGQSLVTMFRSGALDAAVKGAAGIGRAGAAGADWEKGAVGPDDYYELIAPDQNKVREWYERTSIYPFHGVLAVRSDVLEGAPWVAESLYRAFCESKAIFLNKLSDDPDYVPVEPRYAVLKDIVGRDPLPYGSEANRPSIEALLQFCREQKLTHTQWTATSAFADVG
jgi:4,5-dihydroxyphthalate decarboxylase